MKQKSPQINKNPLNWCLKNGFIEIYDKDKLIFKRKFLGWQKRPIESSEELRPKIELSDNELLIYKNNGDLVIVEK